jgi:hypothetical protein
MYLIADPGSTHLGKFDLAKEHVEQAYKVGFNAIKFQLCLEGNGNIPAKKEWVKDLVKVGKSVGIDVFASVWDIEGIDCLRVAGCKKIKFAHSMRHSPLFNYFVDNVDIRQFEEVFVTYSFMDMDKKNTSNCSYVDPFIKLWTITDSQDKTVYPVTWSVNHNWNTLNRFDGFSCHSMDPLAQYKLCKFMGYRYFEMHTKLVEEDYSTPDSLFATSYCNIKVEK